MASLSVSQTLREDFLTCKVCFNIFHCPKLLPCLHTYCRKCISQLLQRADSNTFLCPECRKPALAQNGDPDSFQTNFYVSGLVETFTVEMCSVCKLRGDKKAASHQCIDCGDSLCESCSVGHLASRSTVNHRVVTVEDAASGKYDDEIKSKKRMFCEEHQDKECAFYCKSCCLAICVHCALLVHRDHQLSSLEEKSSEALGNANCVLEKSQDVLKQLASLWTKVQRCIKEKDERQQATIYELETATEQMIQVIIAQKEDTLTKLQEFYDSEIRQYAALKQEIDTAGNLGRKLVDSLQLIVNKESSAQMLHLNETLKHGLAQLESSYQTLSQKLLPESQIVFSVNSAVYQSSIFSVYRVGESNDSVQKKCHQFEESFSDQFEENGPQENQKSVATSLSDLSRNEGVNNQTKCMSISCDDLAQFVQPASVQKTTNVDHTAKLKNTLQNFKILDPPTAMVKPAQMLRKTSIPIVEANTDPAMRSYSDVLKHSPSIDTVPLSPGTKLSKPALTLVSKVNLSVKKDTADPEIKGLSFFGQDRILVSDSANKKVKSFMKDGSAAFLKEFKENGFSPSSVCSVKDVVAFTLGSVVHIVTKQYVPIAKVHVKSSAASEETSATFPLCWYDEDSFLISNLHGNKQWVLKVSGEMVRELQCPARSPVVAVSRDTSLNYYLSSWGQPGSVVVVDANIKRLVVLQPLIDGKPPKEWYPGYSACDSAGNTFVADPNHNQIVLFNRSGRHVVSYDTRADGLLEPLCLVIDQKDKMFVTGKNKEAFIYKIQRRKPSK